MNVPSPLGAPHVLMTADAVGGVWTYALDLGRELVRSGVRVTLAVIGPAADAEGQRQAEAAGLDLRPLGGDLDWTAESEAGVAASAARLATLTAEAGVSCSGAPGAARQAHRYHKAKSADFLQTFRARCSRPTDQHDLGSPGGGLER